MGVVRTQMKHVSGLINSLADRARAARRTPAWDVMVDDAVRARTQVRALPQFGADGKLPAAIHDADLGSFLLHVGTNPHRRDLYGPFAQRLLQLRDRGVREVYVAGSGISAKAKPGDVDALYHVSDSARLPVRERLSDWAVGTHWHGAERRHFAPQTEWGLQRPTWLEFFSHQTFQGGMDKAPVIRVLLDDTAVGARTVAATTPDAASGALQLAR